MGVMVAVMVVVHEWLSNGACTLMTSLGFGK